MKGLERKKELILQLELAFANAVGAAVFEKRMRQDQAYWLRVKGDGLVEKGRYDLALQDNRGALAIYKKIGAQAEQLEVLHDSGRLHLLIGDSASAERDFKRALETAQSIGLDRGITLNLIALGDVEFRRKRPDAALALYERGTAACRRSEGATVAGAEPAAPCPREPVATAACPGFDGDGSSVRHCPRDGGSQPRSRGALFPGGAGTPAAGL